MGIRTPDQRLRIFVSSTLQELAGERRAVREAIESLRLTPVMFELGARPHPPRALYRAYLEQSDVFVGLYWQRYGWVAPGEDVSGLEDEYRLAGDRPKLIYLKEPAPEREPRLAALLGRIGADDRVSYRRFSDADELRSLVADDLAVLVSERFGADRGPSSGRSLVPPEERPLPRPLTRLVGRESQIDRLATILSDPSRRLVTVVGPGGIGKTRLAVAVAARIRDSYADGVFFVPLAAIVEPSLLIPSIAGALGLSEGGGVSIGMALRRALADARALLVLDNLEQLADAASELADLLAATSRLQILVTSRSVLNVGGEHVFELSPLDVATGTGERSPAVELFLDRMAAVRGGYAPSEDELAAIGELSRRLDGIPLAIELAAAQMRVLTPRGLLERMGHRRLAMLTTGPRDLPPRQRALRETMSWSYNLLAPPARVLFARLAVVVGSADLAAIEAIVDPERDHDVVGLLGSLVDASLVRTLGDGREVRFGMLETIREFAAEQLEASGEAERFRARHAEHYLSLAASGSAGLRGPDQLDWLDRFDVENDNLRAVLRRAVSRGNAATGVRLGLDLSWFWQMRSQYAEGRSWMEAVRSVPGATRRDRAAAWTVEALLAFWQGDLDLVEAGVDEAMASLHAPDDAGSLAVAVLLRSLVTGTAEPRPAAEDAVAEAALLLETETDRFLEALTLMARSYVAYRSGRDDEAARLAEQALELSNALGEWYVRSVACTALATVALERGQLHEVRRLALDALVAARKLRNLSSAAYALELWAAAEMRDGRLERAGRIYALGERAYGLARARPWRENAPLLASISDGLRRALGPRLDGFVSDARTADFDSAIAELARSQPSA